MDALISVLLRPIPARQGSGVRPAAQTLRGERPGQAVGSVGPAEGVPNLAENDIPVPNHIVINRNEEVKPGVMPDWSRDFEAPSSRSTRTTSSWTASASGTSRSWRNPPTPRITTSASTARTPSAAGTRRSSGRLATRRLGTHPPPAPDSSKPYTPVRRDAFSYTRIS